jgi:hypothetical protein
VIRRSFLVASIGFLALAAFTTAQGPTKPVSEALPTLALAMSGSYGGGSTSSIVLSDAQWYETLMFVGDTRDRNICVGGTTGPRSGAAALPDGQHPMVTWRVRFRREAFDGATATIAVRWRREVHDPDVQPSTDLDGEFRWRPSEGSTRTIDFVRQKPQATAECETQGLELRYSLAGADELRDAAIGYDVWLLQRLPSGEGRTYRLQTSAQQGAGISFAFPAAMLQKPGSGSAPPLELRVNGNVMGRVRRDGRIELAVDAGRLVGVAGRGLWSGGSGRTRLVVDPNETVELQPPPLHGDNDGPYAEVLRDAGTAIRIRARRLW